VVPGAQHRGARSSFWGRQELSLGAPRAQPRGTRSSTRGYWELTLRVSGAQHGGARSSFQGSWELTLGAPTQRCQEFKSGLLEAQTGSAVS